MLLVTVVLWALNLTLTRYILQHGFEPLAYAVVRYGLAAAIFLAIALVAERTLGVARRDLGLVALAALFLWLNQISFVYALDTTSASTIALILGATPAFAALIGLALGLERMSRRFWGASLVSFAGVGLLAIGSTTAYMMTRTPSVPDALPGDDLVKRALDEYDLFYNDKALSSLRTALARVPEHPRANAYLLLFGGASDSDRARALAISPRARLATDDGSKNRTLLDAAVAFSERGPVAARTVLTPALIGDDRELAFWAAELDYRAGNYKAARDGYAALLAHPEPALRGRIYDHYSSVLLYLDEPAEALRIGTLYRDAFSGEADAVAVYATTLAAVGDYGKAIAAAEDALALSEGEDTLAGLAKVLALSGDRTRAKDLYRRSLDKAGASRRPIRRAALALLQYIDNDVEAARATVAPCLARPKQADSSTGVAGVAGGGATTDATARERGACLFVAGIIDPGSAETMAVHLDTLAAEATDLRPAYGAPRSLAALVRTRAKFFGGGCVVSPEPDPRGDHGALDASVFDLPVDFYAAYHVPYFATWAICEKAAHLAATGKRDEARKLLTSVADRGKNRTWLLTAAERYR